jgi:hypothetical protein
VKLAYYLLLVTGLLGCSSASKPYKTAAVSGRVTLDGKPLAGARVIFQVEHTPQAGLVSGPEAHGETDANGNYSLTTVFKDRGATVGRNRVMISTRKLQRPANNPDGPVKEVAPEKVPGKYFTDKAPLYFDVPARGTSSANFDLTSK